MWLTFCQHPDMVGMSEENKIELELLTDVDVLLMVEKGIRGGMFDALHRYT